MPSLIFSCNFCSFKTSKQINLNAHYLFYHLFENPECSTDTQSVVENFMYSKEHFRTCIICNRYTAARASPKNYSKEQITSPRSMCNFFCDYHLNYLINGQVAEKENRLDQKSEQFKKKYYQAKKYHDAIWSYMQSILKTKYKMHQKTLNKFHFDPSFKQYGQKPLD